ncbi:DUF4365 domain-containing protein [bacterium]|nr:DUF4365 domain-containing protein [bacterium]
MPATDINEQGQQFSFAYVRAVASVAGCSVTRPEVDDDSVDLSFSRKGGNGPVTSPRLEAQAKHWRRGPFGTEGASYPLKVKNYDELRDPNMMVPRILIVVLVPKTPEAWLTCNDEDLVLRHTAVWTSLEGMPESPNDYTVSVPLDPSQRFTPQALTMLLDQIGSGGA